MAEYISKEFMLKNLEADKTNNAEHCLPVTVQIMERFIRYVKEFPTADVQPIVYAHKTINVGRRSYCSNCGKLAIMEDFCSKCGAEVKDGDIE